MSKARNLADLGDDFDGTDLTLSGGVYLGGTGAANKLDDYEEGTWTPTNPSVTLTGNVGVYVKVGGLVYVSCQVNYPSNSSTDDAHISGLPYAAAGGSATFSGNVSITDYGGDNLYAFVESNGSRIFVRNNTNNNLDCADLSGKFMNVQAVYKTNA